MEESFNWLKPIINSCGNSFHVDCCKTLLKLFAERFNLFEQFHAAYKELHEDLQNRIAFIQPEEINE